MKRFKLGTYKHFKGQICQALMVARHSENLEEYVVYQHPNKETGQMESWVRPRAMFEEKVVVNGKRVPRFEYIKS